MHWTPSEERQRTCIVAKGLEVTTLPQVSTADLTVILLKTNLGAGEPAEILVGSAYMPCDSADSPPPEEFKNLVDFATNRGLELLVGCDPNSHHSGWGSTNTN